MPDQEATRSKFILAVWMARCSFFAQMMTVIVAHFGVIDLTYIWVAVTTINLIVSPFLVF